MVEQRSPKPRAEGSSPSAPAKQERPPLVRRSFLFYRAKENPRHAERAGQRLRAPPRRRLLHIVRGDFQNHRLLISRRPLFAKGHAPFACSVVNALATALCRYQPFARKKKVRAGVGAYEITEDGIEKTGNCVGDSCRGIHTYNEISIESEWQDF